MESKDIEPKDIEPKDIEPKDIGPRKSRRGLKVGLTILGTVLLGAIGSGIWARIGDPITSFLVNALINGINLFFSSYKDSIYIEASYGFVESSANMLYSIFVLTVALFYITIVVFHPWLTDRYPAGSIRKTVSLFFKSRRGFILLGIITFSVLSSSVIEITRISYINRVVTYAHNSIDRLAPFLTHQESKELLAEFRNVRSAEDYYKFYDKLLRLYSKNGIAHRSVRPL